MAGEQYLAFYEETLRGTPPGSPVMRFLQLNKGWPKFKAKDVPRPEFSGVSNAMGDRNVWRQESQYDWQPEFRYRPGIETALLLKHAGLVPGARTLLDGTAYKGLMYPVAMPYGSGMPLGTTALGIVPNLDEAGTTKSQVFGGDRFKSFTFTFKGTEEVMLSFDGGGAGDWVGAPDQVKTPGMSMPLVDPFNSSEVKYYIGSGISRTGTAPDFTDIAPGTMTQFFPEDLSLKVTTGLADKFVGNGLRGPSKTFRTGKLGIEVDLTIDYDDPASGFSSADEYKALFSGPRTNSILIVMTHTALAGAATASFQTIIDLPLLYLEADPRDPDNEGKTVQQKLKYKHLVDSNAVYPIGIMTVDRATAY
jgi:hypothetical protein